ncbi:lysophospholipid acyltransferase family protein [Streptomyces sp. NPDC005876]|uniref:lysophospholipid acyltransferase family protein n=1 Tax=Streptomyces sp. NPDC005876 TaxID=3157076 RepID=UPI0033EA5DD4
MHTYRGTRALMKLAGAAWCPTTVEGAEHVPAGGPVLLVGNHLAACDTFFLMAAVHRRLVFLSKREYFTGTGPRGRALAGFCRRLGFLPVDRGAGPAAAREALDRGRRVLDGGGALALYPEGTRSPDGRLYRGRPGAAALALTCGVPLVPFGISGTDRVQPVGASGLRRHPVRIRFGRPLGALPDERRPDGFPTTAALRETTSRTMHAIADLSGQPYVDRPAPAPRTGRG